MVFFFAEDVYAQSVAVRIIGIDVVMGVGHAQNTCADMSYLCVLVDTELVYVARVIEKQIFTKCDRPKSIFLSG